jgi:mRNA-degrading endonuclease RelE of RelBE toxin-antitoxin system
MKQWRTIYVQNSDIDAVRDTAESYFKENGIQWNGLLKNIDQITYPFKPGMYRINVYVTDEEATLLTLRFG